MVLGDSYANRLIMGLDKLTDDNYLQLSDGGCPGLLGLAALESNQKRAADKCSDYADNSIKV